MLCNTCQWRQRCLLPKLATGDQQLQEMLQSLKKCELQRLESTPRLLRPLCKITQRGGDFSRWLKKWSIPTQ